MRKLILIAIAAAGLVGCASVPMGDAQADATAKKFAPQSNKAGIYIYRNESIGGTVAMDVEVDGKPIGQTAAKTYLYTQVAPGRHTITSKAENTDSLTIDTKPGMLYYVWQEVKMGVLYARNKLQLVDAATGQKGVQESSLAVAK